MGIDKYGASQLARYELLNLPLLCRADMVAHHKSNHVGTRDTYVMASQ